MKSMDNRTPLLSDSSLLQDTTANSMSLQTLEHNTAAIHPEERPLLDEIRLLQQEVARLLNINPENFDEFDTEKSLQLLKIWNAALTALRPSYPKGYFSRENQDSGFCSIGCVVPSVILGFVGGIVGGILANPGCVAYSALGGFGNGAGAGGASGVGCAQISFWGCRCAKGCAKECKKSNFDRELARVNTLIQPMLTKINYFELRVNPNPRTIEFSLFAKKRVIYSYCSKTKQDPLYSKKPLDIIFDFFEGGSRNPSFKKDDKEIRELSIANRKQ
jgi:hypothetical protein